MFSCCKLNYLHSVRRQLSTGSSLKVVDNIFDRILSRFPDGIQLAFAYGSGIFPQSGHQDMSKNMLDFIFAVDDPVQWHRENLKHNSKHYSFLNYLGPARIAKIQDGYGAGIYYNTLVPVQDRIIKYGIISTATLINDLLDWETLYVSGRLHKPVRFLIEPSKGILQSAVQMNQVSAVHAAVLLLPETFTEEELFVTITALSYSGDFRMKFGEDKNKVRNIVTPNMERFRKMYEKILDNEEHIYWNKSKGQFEQYPNHISQYHHLNLLPKTLQMNLVALRHQEGHHGSGYLDAEEVLRNYAHDSLCSDKVKKCVEQIVGTSSWSQSIKSIFTAGLMKSTRYSLKKLTKMWKSSKS